MTLKKGYRLVSHSVVMPGGTIRQTAIVGALSFVSKDIPNNRMAFGVPVRIV